MKVGMNINDKWISDTGLHYDQILCNLIVLAAERLAGKVDDMGEPLIITALVSMNKCLAPQAKITSLAYSLNDYIDDGDLREAGLTAYMLFVVSLLTANPNEEYADRMNRIAKNRVAIEVELKRLETVIESNRSHFMNEFDIALNAKHHMAAMFLEQQLNEYRKMDTAYYNWSN